jgi:septal ring factor EnvC (AmiA/AmiB activator)
VLVAIGHTTFYAKREAAKREAAKREAAKREAAKREAAHNNRTNPKNKVTI